MLDLSNDPSSIEASCDSTIKYDPDEPKNLVKNGCQQYTVAFYLSLKCKSKLSASSL